MFAFHPQTNVRTTLTTLPGGARTVECLLTGRVHVTALFACIAGEVRGLRTFLIERCANSTYGSLVRTLPRTRSRASQRIIDESTRDRWP